MIAAIDAVAIAVNGRSFALDVPPNTLLIDFLREQLQLTGTHQGCDTAQCGACTVLVDGLAIKSCNRLVLQCAGQKVTTIEGLAILRSQAGDSPLSAGPQTSVLGR